MNFFNKYFFRTKTAILYLLIVLFFSLISTNSLLTFFALVLLPIVFKLVWRRNEPAIFLFIILYHWLQISVLIFHANFLGLPVRDISISNSIDQVILLSLTGLFFLALGIHIIIKNIKSYDLYYFKTHANSYSLKKLFIFYIIVFIVTILLLQLRSIFPTISNIILAVTILKTIVLIFILYIGLLQNNAKFILSILLIEFLYGLTSFFSDFKTVFFLFIIIYATFKYSFNTKTIVAFLSLLIVLLSLGAIWTTVKQDYRSSLNKGEYDQEVKIGVEKQFTILSNLISNIDQEKLLMSIEILAYRLSYVGYFSAVYDYVPEHKNYELGALWGSSFSNIIMPRFLFPDKAALDDSARTRKYTGIYVSGVERGTSIGIGYFAESYIDFGPIFMFIPIFLLGVLYGLIYKFFLNTTTNKILAYALIVSVLFIGYRFEIRNDKLIGGLFSGLIMALILRKLLLAKIFRILFKKRLQKKSILHIKKVK